MKVTIAHQEGMRFKAITEKSSFIIDAPVISPIEYFLSGLICCSATDVVQIPKNQGFEVKNLSIDGEVVRNEEMPRKFVTLHLSYSFDSSADDTMASHWVMCSIETYCSTINTVRDTTKIHFTIIHNGKTIKEKEPIISGMGSDIDLGEINACDT